MKPFLLLLPVLFFSTAPAVSAHGIFTTAGVGQERAATDGGNTSGIAEAARLSAEVVRLYGERKFGEAQPMAERVLALREKSLGGEHPLVASALHNLAAILAERDKHKQAEAAYRRAASILEKSAVANARLLIETRRLLAALLVRKGNFTEAVSLLESAVTLGEQSPSRDASGLADAFNLYSQILIARGNTADVEKAAYLFHRALTLRREVHGKEDPRVEAERDNMYCLFARTGRQMFAVEFWKHLSHLEAKAEGRDPLTLFGANVIEGKAISKPAPSYPESAKANGISGAVVVKLTVDETGKVIEAKAICGPPQLGESSVQAARRSLFQPTYLSGVPVKVTGIITYNYVLQ